jgi:hypothetical protein
MTCLGCSGPILSHAIVVYAEVHIPGPEAESFSVRHIE